MTRLQRRSIISAAAAALAALAFPALAGAGQGDLYWANLAGETGAGTIGHATLHGGQVDQSYIKSFDVPCGVAVDKNYVYWADASSTVVNRAKRKQHAKPDDGFLSHASSPCGVAVTGKKVYATNQGPPYAVLSGPIGGGKMKVLHSDAAVDGVSGDCGVAVDSTKVYWLLDGTDPIGHYPFYDLERTPQAGGGGTAHSFDHRATYRGCGIDVAGGYLYVAETSPGAVNRVALTHKPETPFTYIAGHGIETPCGVAVAGNHIYWGDRDKGTIGRANLDGTHIKPSFITGASEPCGVAATDN
ncbi:MAG: hypothetical protein QOE29_223 [Gaiellaceae bacterium]|nr:hypothetical protein [Gaiellaceae bacterium]